VEKQKDQTEAHTVRGLGATQGAEGQTEGKDAWEMGRPIHSNGNRKRSSFQTAPANGRRRAIHLECGHASEILRLKQLQLFNLVFVVSIVFSSFFTQVTDFVFYVH
jgi:hypothetical protein